MKHHYDCHCALTQMYHKYAEADLGCGVRKTFCLPVGRHHCTNARVIDVGSITLMKGQQRF